VPRCLTSRNSMTPSRAFLTMGVSVLIFMPGPAGMAQEATGLGLFSTCGRRRVRDQQRAACGAARARRAGARACRWPCALAHLHQAHAAVARDGEPLVVAEPAGGGGASAGLLSGAPAAAGGACTRDGPRTWGCQCQRHRRPATPCCPSGWTPAAR
jgi:hypothetical protein